MNEIFHIDSLTFSILNSLKIKYHSEKFTAFNTFFSRLHNLKKLSFSSETIISTSDFRQLTAGLIELENVEIPNIAGNDYEIEDLFNFIRNHPNLKSFSFPRYAERDEFIFRHKFESNPYNFKISKNGTSILLKKMSFH